MWVSDNERRSAAVDTLHVHVARCEGNTDGP